MKRKLQLLALVPALLLATGCEVLDMIKKPKDNKEAESVNVIILSGQSNAAGCKASARIINSMGQEKYDEYFDGYEGIKISFSNWSVNYENPNRPKYRENYSEDGEFVPVKLGYGNTIYNFGPEVGMAEELHEKWANKLYIIKVPCGASNLNDDWADQNEEMFKTLCTYVDDRMEDLKEAGFAPKLRAFCWMQGEGDSYDHYWQYYYDNLVRFKGNLDKRLLKYTEDNNLPFIDAGIGAGEGEWVYYQEVNDCKKDFAKLKPTNIYFDTIEAGLHSNQEPNDNVHYDSESQIKLGHLFAQNFEQFLK